MTAGHCGWFQPYNTPHSLMSPALQLHSRSSSYFQFLLVWLSIETALRETLERCLSDPRSRIRPAVIHHRADPSVTYANHPFGFVWFLFLAHVFEILLLESYAELKKITTTHFLSRMENRHEERLLPNLKISEQLNLTGGLEGTNIAKTCDRTVPSL